MYTSRSTNEWIFGGLMAAQAIIILAIEIFILVEWQLWMRPQAIQVTPSYIVLIDAAIIWFASIYEFLLSVDAMRNKNNILLFAICVSNVFAMAFAAMQYPAMKGFCESMPEQRAMPDIPLVDISRNIWPQIRGPQLTVPIFIGLCTLGIWGLAFQLHKQYAWSIYRSVQGDSRMRARYLAYEVYVVLVKLGAFFVLCFVLHYGLIDVHFIEPEFGLTMSIPPALTIAIVLGVYFIRREHKPLMILAIVCHLAIIAYLLSRIVVLFGDSYLALTPTKNMTLLFAFASLILTFLSLACGIRCFMNFGYGLKSILAGKPHSVRASYDFHTISRHTPMPDDISCRRLSLA
ncbi:hypothetical protein E8E15_002206 [Penicillium rubens]|uniref:Pc12g02490 protein n=3 Tax=Penicillium chrysogenum species complex TaxID=254878 RepID=B6H027_PENRW|nr:hypothetical protein E8E15_002206 [Penicillium rubens]CAP79876.1 Pc12g02490 [Penicillium rubens Wisconsin 54-1255]